MNSKGRGATHFLLSLQTLNNGCELAQHLVGLLVVLDLGGDELGQVAEGLRGIKDLISVRGMSNTREALL